MPLAHEITPGLRSKGKQRKGRGESSGRGKTSGRGNKGSKARNGKYIRRGYEGGQTEIFRRFPKRGFNNVNFESKFYVVNVGELNKFDDGATIDQTVLVDAGLVPDDKLPLKILGTGELKKKLTITAKWYSKTAHEQITKLGGTANNLEGAAFEFPKEKPVFVKREKTKAAE